MSTPRPRRFDDAGLAHLLETDRKQGVLLLNASGEALFANAVARRMLQRRLGCVLARRIQGWLGELLDRASTQQAPALSIQHFPDNARRRLRVTLQLVGSAADMRCEVRIRRAPVWRAPECRRLEGRYDLTPRQAEVAKLAAQGSTNGEIADALGIRPKTVKNVMHEVLRKMSARNRTEVALKAFGISTHD